MRDIIITIPSTIPWTEYEKELKLVEDGNKKLNFKVSNFPKETDIGNKCYLCHNGYILGYMIITGMNVKNFNCEYTNKKWNGKFIERSGKFHEIEHIPMKGFQGFKYFE